MVMEDITQRTPENVPAEPQVFKRYTLDTKTEVEVRDDGVWFMESKVTKAGKAYQEATRAASSVIDIEGLVDPIDSEVDAGLLVRIDDRRATVKREDLIQPQDIGKWLAARKAYFNPKHLSLLARMFMETRPPEVIGYTRNGWQRNGAFVVGDVVLLGVGHVLKTEANLAAYGQRGTFDDWEREVLSRAKQKPAWLFSILVGLSSVLLDPLGIETGTAFNAYGPSGSGKTAGLKAAAGCWGRPDASGCLKSFITTENALEGMFEGGNGIGLSLDEMKTANKLILAQFAYLFGNGMGKERMKSNAEMQRRRRWLLNCIMSSEKSVEGIFEAMEQQQAAGMVTRLVDIDMTDWLPIIDGAAVNEFEATLLLQYGTAGPEFVRRVAGMTDLKERHGRITDALYGGDDPKLGRVARVFAQLKLVGEIMGIETTVVDQVWAAWASEVREAFDDDLQIGRAVLSFIERNLRVSIMQLADDEDDDGGSPFDQAEGEVGNSYKERDGWFDKEFVYLRAEAMAKIMDGFGRVRLYNWLHMRGVLHRPTKGDKWTVRVPKLAHRPSALRIDLDRLQDVVGSGE